MALVVVLAGILGLLAMPGAQASGTGATTGAIAVNGAGFGHGVGMSQYGAYGQAKANPALTGAQIAQYYYTGSTVASYADNVPLKINVGHARTTMALRSTALGTGGGGFWARVVGLADRWVPVTQYVTVGWTPPDTTAGTPAGVLLVVRNVSDGADVQQLRGASATIIWSSGPTTLDVTTTSTKHYRWGTLGLAPAPSGSAYEGVLTIDMHSYLKGVAEMPSSWPAGALQAQVIAARTYALYHYRAGQIASCGGCHMYDSTASQVYAGWAKESEPTYGAFWVAAVAATQDATNGQTVLYAGVPVNAFFFSSSGGRTRNSEDVWSAALPYARSVDDRWSVDPAINPNYAAWTRTASIPTLMSLFGLSDIASVAVSARDAGGAASTVTAMASSGLSTSVTGEVFRIALKLPSSWVTSLGAVPVRFPVPAGLSPVYWQPGTRTVNGRQWQTTCETYSTGARCFTKIWATQYVRSGTTYIAKIGWVHNSVNYFDYDGPAWVGNVYTTPGTRVVNGRTWRTACSPNVTVGSRTCRTEIWASLVSRTRLSNGTYRYFTYQGWSFVSMSYLQ
ncbi:MAG: SpoIID/LytB domain-containing protein [Actinomycetota bacterium]